MAIDLITGIKCRILVYDLTIVFSVVVLQFLNPNIQCTEVRTKPED